MGNVWRISEAATIALHAIVFLAAHDERLYSTKEIAAVHHVSEAHLSKVLQRLSKAGLVNSVRGPKGGFWIGQLADRIRLLDIYESIDGPFIGTTCLLGTPVCTGGHCIMGDVIERVNKEVQAYLSGTSVADVVAVLRDQENRENNGKKNSQD